MISETDIWDEINREWDGMSPLERHFWEKIRIPPEKWLCDDVEVRNEVWAVALLGTLVVWYDDIEDEFQFSEYPSYGTIGKTGYGCAGLLEVVRIIKGDLECGHAWSSTS